MRLRALSFTVLHLATLVRCQQNLRGPEDDHLRDHPGILAAFRRTQRFLKSDTSDQVIKQKKQLLAENRLSNRLRKPYTIAISQFKAMETDFSCEDNLLMADSDQNGLVNSTEFAEFVKTESDGMVSAPFRDLPVPFVMLFIAETCETCFEKTGDTNCCLGRKAAIDLTEPGSEQFVATVDFICDLVNQAIDQLPQLSTEPPTVSPTTGPLPTQAPTGSTLIPTRLPKEPTIPPSTQSPTDSTTVPTMVPREPTSSPITNFPTQTPTVSTDLPTEAPTQGVDPTTSPTNVPTASPTDFPSTLSPTVDPRVRCMQFSYVLSTDDLDLTAFDILNGVDNNIREGLEAATEETVIEILNVTFPRLERRKTAQIELKDSRQAIQAGFSEAFGPRKANELLSDSTNSFHPIKAEQRLALTIREHRSAQRRLVFYSETLPPKVVFVLDVDPAVFPTTSIDCTNENSKCFLVQTEVCVFLEEGDNFAVIQLALMDGLRIAIDSGAFESRIPDDVTVGS